MEGFEEQRNFKDPYPEFDSATFNEQRETVETLKIFLRDVAKFTERVKPGEMRALASVREKTEEDFSIFDGAGGYLFAFLKLSQFCKKLAEKPSLAEIAQQIVQNESLRISLDPQKYLLDARTTFTALESLIYPQQRKRISFFFGAVGIYLLGAHLHYDLGDSLNFRRCVDKVLANRAIIANTPSRELYHELLYGSAGYLYCLLDLQHRYELADVSAPFKLSLSTEVLDLCDFIVKSGLDANPSRPNLNNPLPQDFRLTYNFHGREYFGAAHGLCGILYLLIRAYEFNKNALEVHRPELAKRMSICIWGSLQTVLRYQLPSGNFPSSFAKLERDSLVQFCHGSPGVVPCLLKASDFYSADPFGITLIEAAKKGGDNIWKCGILKKGFGLCHGITGNAYSFLDLFRLTKERKWLYRAFCFARLKTNESILQGIRNYDFEDRYAVGISDYPYSLMMGLAGDISYFVDLLVNIEDAKFPGYQV
eukprot:TRINITY_DN561_c0_g2_i3.p1 TRINITY_DN561_c0_g2~~TRINITY_DN561_c0_g2_i3.p1  ORF type:complete len:480 (-),score=53.81 TRINITY_DN561_c0_g2_i3:660-2099(-)